MPQLAGEAFGLPVVEFLFPLNEVVELSLSRGFLLPNLLVLASERVVTLPLLIIATYLRRSGCSAQHQTWERSGESQRPHRAERPAH
jgi:hypothetical protein